MGALEYEIDVFVVVRAQHVPQLDDVFMVVELLQEHAKSRQKENQRAVSARHSHDFTEGSLRVGCILKSVKNFFQGDCLAGLLVDGLQTSRWL